MKRIPFFSKKSQLSKASKRLLFFGLAVSAAVYIPYILWNAIAYRGTVDAFSKQCLAEEAVKLMLTCVIELLAGAYVIDKAEKSGM